MPVPARIRNLLAVLALAAPATPVLAQSPAASIPMPSAAPTLSPAPGYDSAPAMETAPAPAAAPAPHRHRWSLLRGRRHCPECRRADVMNRTGLNIPPVPPLPGAVVNRGDCADCGQPVMVANAKPTIPGPGGYAPASAYDAAPGLASVGDMAAPDAGPMPVGMSAEGLANNNNAPGFATTGPRSPTDTSLMQTAGMANDPISPHAHNRPHIISHLLGLDALKAVENDREDKRKTKHAAMTYGPANLNVTELTTKQVYGK